MNERIEVILIILGMLAAISAVGLAERLPFSYRVRACQGKRWRRAFPDASKHDIRQFPLLLETSFAFKAKQILKFNPQDRVLDVYRARNPCRWEADGLELETLDQEIRAQYGVSLCSIWRDEMTLGQLFTNLRSRAV